MTDEDGHRIEAAEQFGFTPTEGDTDGYICTEAQLIAFAKACERKALCTARSHVRQELNNPLSARDKSPLKTILGRLSKQIAAIDAVNAPLLEAERVRQRAASEPAKCSGGQSITCDPCEICGATMDDECKIGQIP